MCSPRQAACFQLKPPICDNPKTSWAPPPASLLCSAAASLFHHHHHSCACSCCRMESLANTQNKLLMRLSQLRATEALFCDLVASCPAAAQQLPDLSYPLLTAAAGGGRPGLGCSAAAGASSKAHAAATRWVPGWWASNVQTWQQKGRLGPPQQHMSTQTCCGRGKLVYMRTSVIGLT